MEIMAETMLALRGKMVFELPLAAVFQEIYILTFISIHKNLWLDSNYRM